jgi:hypothetical protein
MPILPKDLTKWSISRIPELSLISWSFFLNFFWEVVQTYFYTMKDSAFGTMIYGWIHCTLGDVVITLGSFWLVSIVSHNRRWFLRLNRVNFVGFIMVGIIYTFLSEWLNVNIFKSWGYNESMPIIPLIKVGLTPFLQWMVIPPVAILLVRHHFMLEQEVAKRKEGKNDKMGIPLFHRRRKGNLNTPSASAQRKTQRTRK